MHRVLPNWHLLSLVLIVFGCSAAKDVTHVVAVSSDIIAVAEPCIVAAYRQEQLACVADHPGKAAAEKCVADVRAKYQPIENEVGDLRGLRCTLEPLKCHPGEAGEAQ